MDKKHSELKKLLQEKLASAQARNSSFSMRAFAKQLDMTPSSISEFFNNKRSFSDKKINQLLERVGMSPQQVNDFGEKHKSKEVLLKTDIERLKLDSDKFFLVSDPIYYSILSLVETKSFEYDFEYISKRLSVRIQDVAAAVQRLLELNLIKEIKVRGKDKLKINTNHLDTITGITSQALRLRHQNNLEKAQDSLHNLPTSERFFTFETLAVDKSKLPEVQELFYRFLDELHTINGAGPKDEVYEFCFHYFPRTKTTTDH